METASFIIECILAAISITGAIVSFFNRKAAKKSAKEAAEFADNANAANLKVAEYYKAIMAPNLFACIEEDGASLVLKAINNSLSVIENIRISIDNWDELTKDLSFGLAREQNHIDDIKSLREVGFSLMQGKEKAWIICPQSSDFANRVLEKESITILTTFTFEGREDTKVFTIRTALFSKTKRRLMQRNEKIPLYGKFPW